MLSGYTFFRALFKQPDSPSREKKIEMYLDYIKKRYSGFYWDRKRVDDFKEVFASILEKLEQHDIFQLIQQVDNIYSFERLIRILDFLNCINSKENYNENLWKDSKSIDLVCESLLILREMQFEDNFIAKLINQFVISPNVLHTQCQLIKKLYSYWNEDELLREHYDKASYLTLLKSFFSDERIARVADYKTHRCDNIDDLASYSLAEIKRSFENKQNVTSKGFRL